MKLKDYLEVNHIPPRAFAADIEVSPEAVRLYVRGLRRPRHEVLERIHIATGGMVRAEDFYGRAA